MNTTSSKLTAIDSTTPVPGAAKLHFLMVQIRKLPRKTPDAGLPQIILYLLIYFFTLWLYSSSRRLSVVTADHTLQLEIFSTKVINKNQV